MEDRVGGKTVGEMMEAHEAWSEAQPMTARCAVCSWTFDGSVAAAREASAAHRAKSHPELRQLTRKEREARVKLQRQDEAAARAEQARSREALAALDNGTAQEPPPRPPAVVPAKWDRESAVAAVKAYAERHGRPPSIARASGDPLMPSQPTARKLFGGWAPMIEAAGFPRPTRSTRYGLPPEPAEAQEDDREPGRDQEPEEQEADPVAHPATVPPEAVFVCPSCGGERWRGREGATRVFAGECQQCGSRDSPVPAPLSPSAWTMPGLPAMKPPVSLGVMRPDLAPPAAQEPLSRAATVAPIRPVVPAPTDDTRPLRASELEVLAERLEAAAALCRAYVRLGDWPVQPRPFLDGVLLILRADVEEVLRDDPAA